MIEPIRVWNAVEVDSHHKENRNPSNKVEFAGTGTLVRKFWDVYGDDALPGRLIADCVPIIEKIDEHY